MKEKIKHYAKEIVYFILFMTIIANLMSIYKSQDLNSEPLQLTSLTLLDNSVYNFKENRPVLIHFWATWCPTCKLEASNINYISKHFNVVTIAVNSGSTQEIQKFLTENEYTFLVNNDAQSILSQKFKIAGFPTTFIYDKDRKLIFSEVGYTSIVGLYFRMWWASL